ncbi:VID27-domain-containing protein [Thozetella sp. PMI_491]|nr:VID27-domain-containing protein [Thozetella sp. PMI_491]
MFALRNIGKLIFGSGSQESLIELPQGQLYLVRPLSPKGYSELIFKDSAARIRKTAQDFQYQLVVQRVYEEGEAELLAEEEGGEGEDDADILAAERDEKTFLLDEALHFRVESREGSEIVLAWRDLSGDAGDLYEFVCDAGIQPSLVDKFELVAKQCQYERKYRKPNTTATNEDLLQFEFSDEQPIPPASPLHGPTLTRSIESTDSIFSSNKPAANTGVKRDKAPEEVSPQDLESAPSNTMPADKTASPAPPSAHPEPREILALENAELHFFDFPSGSFVLQDSAVAATVTEVGDWQYYLQVGSNDRDWLGIPVVADINPVFNFEFLSFIFNQFTEDGSAYSWLLRFKDQPTLERFQEGLLRALWEQLNEVKWTKMKDKERDYVTDAFADLAMEDVPEEPEQEAEEEEEELEDDRDQSEHYDSDEDADDVDARPKDKDTNKMIAVGYKNNRTFVVRGSKIGVFKHTPNNHLQFDTNISKVATSKGELFSPKKVMLHNEDRNLILQKDADPNKLFRMDLEYGKVVDEWKVDDNIPVVTFAPENKFAQMTHEPTFLGVSHNALYRVDPRQAGNKLVDSQIKQYASKNDFSALATTEKGYIAVASNKGDVRLFDRLGINAKTHIPALGEPIIGLDVSANGRWVLATCRTYLLLIDAMQHEGKNEGKLGFERSFAADAKPQPRRLGLTPEHVAQFAHETGKGVNFTPAKFNTGEGTDETSIITATGPYIIEWNLQKVITGRKTPYLIKRYSDVVSADDFKFGTDKNVVVALPNEVSAVTHGQLKKPTRQSIAGDFLNAERRGSGRIGTRESGRYKLGKDDVVNSPY